MRLSLFTFPLLFDAIDKRLDFNDICSLTRLHGIDYVDLTQMELTYFGEAAVGKCLKHHRLQLACLKVFIPILKDDQVTIKENIKLSLIKAHNLGCDKLLVSLMDSRFTAALNGYDIEPAIEHKEVILEKVTQFYRLAVEIAMPYGIKICTETISFPPVFIAKINDFKAVFEAVPDLGYMFNTETLLGSDEKILDLYEVCKDNICHIRMKDIKYSSTGYEMDAKGKTYESCIWGEGVLPIKAVWKKLIEDGYKNFVAIEYSMAVPSGFDDHFRRIDRYMMYLEVLKKQTI